MPPRDPRQRRPNAKGGRAIRHVVRVSAEEELVLAKLANDRSVTVSRLLYEAATGTLPVMKNKVAVTELFGIRHELRKQGTNLNQIAAQGHALRMTGTFHTDLAETLEAIAVLDERLTAWLAQDAGD
jgi:Bacterial mobilisation protein (MobC)